MRQSETNLLSEMKEELQFEKLLIEISTHFVNLPADRIDDEIKEAQRRICEYLDLDRSALWQFSDKEPGKVLLTHVHQPPKALLPDEPLDARTSLPLGVGPGAAKGNRRYQSSVGPAAGSGSRSGVFSTLGCPIRRCGAALYRRQGRRCR